MKAKAKLSRRAKSLEQVAITPPRRSKADFIAPFGRTLRPPLPALFVSCPAHIQPLHHRLRRVRRNPADDDPAAKRAPPDAPEAAPPAAPAGAVTAEEQAEMSEFVDSVSVEVWLQIRAQLRSEWAANRARLRDALEASARRKAAQLSRCHPPRRPAGWPLCGAGRTGSCCVTPSLRARILGQRLWLGRDMYATHPRDGREFSSWKRA